MLALLFLTNISRTLVEMKSTNLQVLTRGKKLGMQLHNGALLLTAPPVGLNKLLPHIPHLNTHQLVQRQAKTETIC